MDMKAARSLALTSAPTCTPAPSASPVCARAESAVLLKLSKTAAPLLPLLRSDVISAGVLMVEPGNLKGGGGGDGREDVPDDVAPDRLDSISVLLARRVPLPLLSMPRNCGTYGTVELLGGGGAWYAGLLGGLWSSSPGEGLLGLGEAAAASTYTHSPALMSH